MKNIIVFVKRNFQSSPKYNPVLWWKHTTALRTVYPSELWHHCDQLLHSKFLNNCIYIVNLSYSPKIFPLFFYLLKYHLSSFHPINVSLDKFYNAVIQFQYQFVQFLENCSTMKSSITGHTAPVQLIYFLSTIQSVLWYNLTEDITFFICWGGVENSVSMCIWKYETV